MPSGRRSSCLRRAGSLHDVLPPGPRVGGIWGPGSRAAAPGPRPIPWPPRAWASAGAGTPWVRRGSPRCRASPLPGAPGPAEPAAGAAPGSPRRGLPPRARGPGPSSSDRRAAPCRRRAEYTLPGGAGATTVGGKEGGFSERTKPAQKGGST